MIEAIEEKLAYLESHEKKDAIAEMCRAHDIRLLKWVLDNIKDKEE